MNAEHTQKLVDAGWRQTRSGRWYHPIAFPGIDGRRGRLFTMRDALALVEADPTKDPATPVPS